MYKNLIICASLSMSLAGCISYRICSYSNLIHEFEGNQTKRSIEHRLEIPCDPEKIEALLEKLEKSMPRQEEHRQKDRLPYGDYLPS